jgi:hypothetical protein
VFGHSEASAHIVLTAAVLAAFLVAPLPVLAGDDLPKAEEVMAKYIEALGGKEALEKIHNRVTKATVAMPDQGITLEVTTYAAEPNKSYVVLESEMMGRIEQGTDGKVSWSKHPMMGGARILEGAEREQSLQRAIFHDKLQWRKLYKKVECQGIESVDGKDCYKLLATPETGNPETWYFAKDSRLLVKTQAKVSTPMGEMQIESAESDWKKVDGVLIAHKMTITTPMGGRVMTVNSVEHNVDLPKDRFDLPEDIKSLIEAEKQPKPKKEEKDTKKP